MSDAEDYDDRDEDEREDEEGEEGDDDAGAAATAKDAKAKEVEPEEELPDEKPYDGSVKMVLGGAAGAAPVVVTVPAEGGGLPAWLPYVLADDEFWFQRTVTGGKKKKAAVSAAGDGGEDGDVGDEGDAPPPAADDAGGEEGEEGAPAFDCCQRFVLVSDGAEPPTYACKVYVPPAPVDAGEGDEAAADADKPADEAAEGGDGTGEGGDGDGDGDDAAAAAAAVAAVAAADEEEPADEVVVDGVVFAAVFSPSALAYMLGARAGADAVDLSTAMAFVHRATDAAGTTGDTVSAGKAVFDAVLNATADGNSPARKVDYAFVFERLATADSFDAGDAALSMMRRLLAAKKFPPAAAINPAHLSSVPAFTAYAELLMTMPRAQLQAWTQPGAADDDGNEAPATVAPWLATVLLDVRRRIARERTGKPPARLSAEAVHARHIPVATPQPPKDDAPAPIVLEQAGDSVVAPHFLRRAYAPETLALFSSDLALFVLGQRDDTAASFEQLFRRKIAVPRERDNANGCPALLWSTAQSHLTATNVATLVRLTPQAWFQENGPVDVATWATNFLADAKIPAWAARGFNDEASFAVACRFLPHMQRAGVADVVAAASPSLAKHLQEAQKASVDFVESLGQPAAYDEATLDATVAKIGHELVCTSAAMMAAVSAKNEKAIVWLLNHGVAQVLPAGATQPLPLLQYAATNGDVELTLFLVACGANLRALWRDGRTTALCYIQDNFPAAATDEVLSVWHAREADRGTDPRRKVGLLHASGI